MYQGETYTGEAAKKFAKAKYPFGAGFSEDTADKVHTVEVWHSSFKDPGPDFNIFKALDANGNLIAENRADGY